MRIVVVHLIDRSSIPLLHLSLIMQPKLSKISREKRAAPASTSLSGVGLIHTSVSVNEERGSSSSSSSSSLISPMGMGVRSGSIPSLSAGSSSSSSSSSSFSLTVAVGNKLTWSEEETKQLLDVLVQYAADPSHPGLPAALLDALICLQDGAVRGWAEISGRVNINGADAGSCCWKWEQMKNNVKVDIYSHTNIFTSCSCQYVMRYLTCHVLMDICCWFHICCFHSCV